MIIVAGHLIVSPGKQAEFVEASRVSVASARMTPGCLDYSVTADTLTPDRVNIFELWESTVELATFRGAGPTQALSSLIESSVIEEYALA